MAEETTGTEEGASAPKKKLSPLAILLTVQCLVVVASMGVIAKFVMFSPKPDLSQKTLTERTIASVRDDAAQIKFMDLDEFVVNLPDERTMQTKLAIELSNEKVESLIKARLPLIRAQILRTLSQQTGQETDRLQGKLLLKDAIRNTLNETLDGMKQDTQGGIVREVLFVNLMLL